MKKYFKAVSLAAGFVTLFALFLPKAYAAPALKPENFEEIADEYMSGAMSEYHVVGAAVSVVKDGKLMFSKGWGVADLEKKTPVDPDKTAFQIASVSKLFTAAAVMQMAEQGRLSLDRDVNGYLTAFKVENPFSEPVTLETLLTHTAGLDGRLPLYVRSNGDVLYDSIAPLESELKYNLPPVVRQPGTWCQYSGYGMALAGYLVQEASGQPIDSYITDHILKPLKMGGSAYGLTAEILPLMAKPYEYKNGEYREGAYTLLGDGPAGSICATASDMAKFMIMLLDGGESGGVRVLAESSVQNMLSHHYPADGRLTGYGLGFYEAMRNGWRTFEHGGHLPSFSSKLSILPEENIGVFIAINTDSPGSGKVCNEFTDIFYDFFTEKNENAEARSAVDANVPLDLDPGRISGVYAMGENSLLDATRIKSVLVTCKVQCDDSGNLRFLGDGLDWKFKYAGGGFFWEQDRGNYCSFTEENGRIVLHILGGEYEKVPAADRILFAISAASVPFFCFVAAFLMVRMARKKEWTGIPAGLLISIGLLATGYYLLSGAVALLSAGADTFLVIHVFLPAIPAVCWALLGFTAMAAVYAARYWSTIRNIKNRAFSAAFLGLTVNTLVFMAIMNGFRILT